MNIEFLLVSYFCSLFVDWVFQFDFQAINKSKWGKDDDKRISLFALITHSFIYAVLTSLFTILIPFLFTGERILNVNQFNIMMIVLFVSHCIIDTRIPVKWIMKFKLITDKQINDSVNYGFMHIGIDHRLHEMVLLILSFVI